MRKVLFSLTIVAVLLVCASCGKGISGVDIVVDSAAVMDSVSPTTEGFLSDYYRVVPNTYRIDLRDDSASCVVSLNCHTQYKKNELMSIRLGEGDKRPYLIFVDSANNEIPCSKMYADPVEANALFTMATAQGDITIDVTFMSLNKLKSKQKDSIATMARAMKCVLPIDCDVDTALLAQKVTQFSKEVNATASAYSDYCRIKAEIGAPTTSMMAELIYGNQQIYAGCRNKALASKRVLEAVTGSMTQEQLEIYNSSIEKLAKYEK